MTFYLSKNLENYFSSKDAFSELMTLSGETFRALENRRTQRVKISEKSYFLKQHFGIGWKEIFKNLFQLRLPICSAKNEWLAIQKLQALNIDTMQISAYGARGFNPARRQSFLLTHELTETISLEDYCKDWAPTFAWKQALIKAVADIARVLHDNGINHRDFYICHFLLSTISQDVPKLSVIDLHRAQIRKRTPERWRIKDLAGLYFSSKDIGLTSRDVLRFIRTYRAQSLREVMQTEKHFWQKVGNRGDTLYQQHGK